MHCKEQRKYLAYDGNLYYQIDGVIFEVSRPQSLMVIDDQVVLDPEKCLPEEWLKILLRKDM